MIDSSTGLYCIFGSPVRHSLSPMMHNAAFSQCGINAVYLAFEPSSVDHAVDSIRTLPISGASITIPFKTAVIPYLDRIDPLAGEIGAVNTIRNSNGVLEGFNTDGIGALGAIEELSGPILGKKVLILGTGGSSRAIAFTLISKGAVVTVAGRQGESRMNLLIDLRRIHGSIGEADINALNMETVHNHEIIVNTTPLGMGSSDSAPINTDFIVPDHTVFDIVYHPHETTLLRNARERGARTIHGIEMLIRQGAEQFRIWTGMEPPVALMREKAINGAYHR